MTMTSTTATPSTAVVQPVYIALRRIPVGHDDAKDEYIYRESGELVPEALEWANVNDYVSGGYLSVIPGELVAIRGEVDQLRAEVAELRSELAESANRRQPSKQRSGT